MKKDQLLLYFGPNERRVGKQFLGDPSVDEAALKLSQFFILPWLQRFPHWRLGVRLMPPAPPAPGALTGLCIIVPLCNYQEGTPRTRSKLYIKAQIMLADLLFCTLAVALYKPQPTGADVVALCPFIGNCDCSS